MSLPNPSYYRSKLAQVSAELKTLRAEEEWLTGINRSRSDQTLHGREAAEASRFLGPRLAELEIEERYLAIMLKASTEEHAHGR